VSSYYNRRQGAIPHSRKFCWMKSGFAAANMIKNIRRAARSGNCSRARHILESREARMAMLCAGGATLSRVERMVRRCEED